MAHEIPYVATATVAGPARPGAKGQPGDGGSRGARYLHVPGARPWPHSAGAARPATPSDCPAWPSRPGPVPGLPRRRRPAGERLADPPAGPGAGVLRLQSRATPHLFGSERRRAAIARGCRRSRTATSSAFGLSPPERRQRHDREQALRHHPGRRVQPGQQDRLVAHRAPRVPGPAPAVQSRPARPGRTSSSGCTTPRRRATRPPGGRSWPTTRLPAIMGRICYRPCETSCNRGQLDSAVGINSVERFLGDQAHRRRLGSPPPAPATGRRVLIVGAGPSGLSRRLSPGPARPPGHGRGLLAAAGGMMRYGIPRYRLPRDVLGNEVDRIPRHGHRVPGGPDRHRRPGRDARRRLRRGIPRGRRPARAAGVHPGRRLGADPGRRLGPAPDRRRAAAAAGRHVVVYGGGDTAMDAARTARRLGATDAVIVYRRTRDRMPAHDVEVQEASAEGDADEVGCPRSPRAGGGMITIEKMRLDEAGFPHPPASSRSWPPTPSCSRWARRPTCRCWTGVPGVEFTDARLLSART